jgi:hypothetical protein
MENVLLSADSVLSVYSVPDAVATNLKEYCTEFCNKWIWESPHAEEYRKLIGVCYNEKDFIKYLNKWVFPDNPSELVETLEAVWDAEGVPDKYKQCEWFNF